MACPGIPCSTPPAPLSWTFTANPSANQFCDAKFIGLAEASINDTEGGALVMVDPVSGCLHRPAAPKGIWQHDPNGCAKDFVGPLDAPEFMNIPEADTGKTHFITAFEQECDGQVSKLVKYSPQESPVGWFGALNKQDCAGSYYWSIMSPEYLTNGRENEEGDCVSPAVLGMVMEERAIGPGVVEVVPRWYSIDKWQQSSVPQAVDADILDPADGTPNIGLAGWRTETCPGGGSVQQLVGLNNAQVRRLLKLVTEELAARPSMVPVWPWALIADVKLQRALGHTMFTFTIAGLPGYLPEYKNVQLRTSLVLGSYGADVRFQVQLAGQQIHDDIAREHSESPSGDFSNNTYTFFMPITAGVKAVTSNWIGLPGDTGEMFEAGYNLSVVGWSY